MFTNIAYTERYLERRRVLEAVFSPEYRIDEPETVCELNGDYSLRCRHYSGEVVGQRIEDAVKTDLLDKNGNTIYSWRCLDCDGSGNGGFLGFRWHAGGKSYLLFRRELYGYSVLEIETGRDFHYVPSCAYPGEGEEFDETFIWCSAAYEFDTGLLAASGCYWGCPYSTVVLDFSDSLAEHPADVWLNIVDVLPQGTHHGFHITPDRWENGALILESFKEGMSRPELIRIPSDKLRAALDGRQEQ